jgi:hypothetical protein
MSGIDFLVKNIFKEGDASLQSPKNYLIKTLFSDQPKITESESLINTYNNTLENIKILNSIFLIYFQEHFKNTGCPDLVLNTLWVIFCISKNKLKNQQIENNSKKLIGSLFAKLNIFFNLENSTNYFKTYFNIHYSCMQSRDSNQNGLFPNNKSEADSDKIYYSNFQEKQFFDEIFSKIFKLNSVLDKDLDENYLNSVLNIPNISENAPIEKEEILNLSLFDTNEITIEKNENRLNYKNLLDLGLNEENQLKINISEQNLNENKQDIFTDLKEVNNYGSSSKYLEDSENKNLKQEKFRKFSIKNLNLNNSLINKLNEENDWNIENANLLFKNLNSSLKIMKSKNKITDYDFARILNILTKFYNRNFFSNSDLDDLLVYQNINLDKFLECSRNISPLSNTNSSYTCIEAFNNYFFTSKEQKTERPKQSKIENDKYSQFIDSLLNYIYIDTNYLIKKYNLKFYCHNNQLENFTYCSIYDNFYENFIKKNDFLYIEINKIKSSYDKNIFLKLIDDYISQIFLKFANESQLKEEEQKIEMNDKEKINDMKLILTFSFSEYYYRFGFDLQYFENLFLLAYYIYLNLLLIGRPNQDEFIHNYIKTINLYPYANYSLLFFHIENLNKLNYSSSINRIVKSFNNLLVSMALISKNSYLYKKVLLYKENEKVETKLEDISIQVNRAKEKDPKAYLYQEFKEKKIKVKNIFNL